MNPGPGRICFFLFSRFCRQIQVGDQFPGFDDCDRPTLDVHDLFGIQEAPQLGRVGHIMTASLRSHWIFLAGQVQVLCCLTAKAKCFLKQYLAVFLAPCTFESYAGRFFVRHHGMRFDAGAAANRMVLSCQRVSASGAN